MTEKREESGHMRGEEETTHKFTVNKCCFGQHRAFPQKKGAAVPRCRCVGRCPPGRGARLHTSSGRSAYKCKQCLPFAEEAPCQQRGVHFSRCFNTCKIKDTHFFNKRRPRVGSKAENYTRGGSIFGSENPTMQEITSHLASFQSSAGWMFTFKLTSTQKCSFCCGFSPRLFCEGRLMLRLFM